MNLNQVTVAVKNIEISIPFYELLGLKLIVKALPDYARFVCGNNATFSLHRTDKLITESGVWIYFETEELDSMINKLQDAGITIDEMPEDKSWLWREARLKDPDGNQLIIYHAGVNRLNPPWVLK